MCYEWGEMGSYHEKKDTAQLDIEVVKKVLEDASPGRPYISLFGGEPLLYEKIGDVLETCKKFDLSTDIPTNGTLLKRNANLLIETAVKRIWVSLDGPEEINDNQRGFGVYKKAIEGIDYIFERRKELGSPLPKIGVTFIVTAFNYQYVEQLFLECLDMSKIDHISIEFQLYTTETLYNQYAEILKTEFNIPQAPCAKGIIWNHNDFKSIDIPELIRQINNVKKYCEDNNIYFIAYPKTIEHENIKSFYSADFQNMKDKIRFCSFPWAYAEINALGEVSSCHTFYDLPTGNVNKEGIVEIFNGEIYKKIQKYLKKQLFPICTACSRYYRDPNKT
jgi:MoaA/NifB/PqqE/SkfB family radical SAM enzyme